MAGRKTALVPDAVIVERILQLLQQAEEPVAVSALAKEFKGPCRCSAERLAELLEQQAAAGRAHRFAPFSGKALRYWSRDLPTYARGLLQKFLAEKPRTLSDLEKATEKRLRDLSKAERRAVLDELVRERRAFELPRLGSSKTARYSAHPPHPSEYVRKPVEEFRKKIEKIAKELERFGIPLDRTRSVALAMWSGESPLPSWPEDAVPPQVEAVPPGSDFAAAFDGAFAELDRQAGSHNFVSLVELRRALADFSREEFDLGLKELRTAGRFGLSAAESVHGIHPDQRAAGIEEAGILLLHVSRKT